MTEQELKSARECPMEVFGHVGPWEDEMITGRLDQVVQRLAEMAPLDAVRLILTTRRKDACIGNQEIDELAEYLGVFGSDDEDDEDGESPKTYTVIITRESGSYVARDFNGDWRAKGKADRNRSGRDLAEYLFHADEIASCKVDADGITVCEIFQK